jgi:hypothetical protein
MPGLENYIVNSARTVSKSAGWSHRSRRSKILRSDLIVPRDRDCRPEGGYRLRLRCAEGRDPLKKTEAGRKSINVSTCIVVPIEDIADLTPQRDQISASSVHAKMQPARSRKGGCDAALALLVT